MDLPADLFPPVFAAQAASTPAAIALVCDDAWLSYQELAERAQALADQLVARGLPPETPVAVLAERGFDLAIALLALLASGAVYVPLDPRHPAARLRLTLEQSRCQLALASAAGLHLLTQAAHDLNASAPTAIQVELLQADRYRPTQERKRWGLARILAPDQLAYVIFTSGSTGVPKGAMVTHRGMHNHLLAKVSALGIGPTDTVVQNASQCFDISIWQFLAAWTVGGTVRITPDEVALDPLALGRAVVETGVTLLETVPSLLQVLLRGEDAPDALGSQPLARARLRFLIPTGEALPPELCRQWFRQVPGVPLLNAYGPTECSDDVTHALLYAPPALHAVRMPIGRPVLNLRLYVLNRGLALLPMGVHGELYVAGTGVGRGYLHDPRRTAEAFRPDPFAATPGARLYYTGDLARTTPDGVLEFLGRSDHQVKVRGFRIELAEIEAVLRQHPKVQAAVVLARALSPRDGSTPDLHLIAYVVGTAAETPAASEDSQALDGWRMVFDEVYAQEDFFSAEDASINLRVWVSSYTGRPFPETEIFESVADSVSRILALAPRRVLELGCGTGLMLFRVAPATELYCGTDLSPAALVEIDRQLAHRNPELRAQVELLPAAADRAHQLEALRGRSFDTILVVEVIQYMPQVAYLLDVVHSALQLVSPGGKIFFGGIRALPLLGAFHFSVLLARASDEMTLAELATRVRERQEQDKELVIDPAFFQALPHHFPQITRVRIQLKGGRAQNEFTRFRFDATLEIGGAPPPELPALAGHALTARDLRTRLLAAGPAGLLVCDLPNARLKTELKALELSRELPPETTVSALRAATAAAASVQPPGFDPVDLWALGAELGYEVEIAWAASGALDCIDVQFLPQNARPTAAPHPAGAVGLPLAATDWSRYGNRPYLAASSGLDLAVELRPFLQERLPEYMVPALFVPLPALPLTPNGKIDRAALPAPDLEQLRPPGEMVLPETPIQALLAEIWAEVLGREQVGIQHNFFELGGHSLLATQVISRVRALLGVELPLRTFFQAPTIAGLAAEIAVRQNSAGTFLNAQDTSLPPLVAAPPGTPPLVSLAQQRLWFLQRLDPHSAAYNVPGKVELLGQLAIPVLARALTAVIARHEPLRTTFVEVQGQPQAVVTAQLPDPLQVVDLRHLPASARRQAAQQITQVVSQRPFDLAVGPLLRAVLVQLTATHHQLILVLHHVISDGWSQAILVRELSALYPALRAGQPSPLKDLALTFRDVAHWQQSWLDSSALAAQLAYWQGRLTPEPPPLELPLDFPRPATSTARGARLPVALSPALTQAVRALSRRTGTTLFMTLLAAWALLLRRFSQQDDLAIGSPIANRNQAAAEDLVGFFVNTLVLRLRPSGRLSGLTLLAQAREVALGAFAHQDLPFEQLVEILKPQRDLGRNPLFLTLLVLQNAPFARLALPDLELTVAEIDNGTAKFDLSLSLTETPAASEPPQNGAQDAVGPRTDGLSGYLEFRRELFTRTTIERLWSGFTRALTALTQDPHQRLAEIAWLSPAELHQLRWEWNAPGWGPAAATTTVLSHFAAQVARSPHAVALALPDGTSWTYAQLAARAQQIATALSAAGVCREKRVALAVTRSLELAAGILGIFQAGGVFVPLDPELPAARCRDLLADADATVLWTEPELLPQMPEHPAVCCAGNDDHDLGRAAWGPPPQPNDLAYLIYTSGTTGKPKAVMVEHGHLASTLAAMQQLCGMAPGDRMPCLAPYSFDIFLFELFAPLCSGGTVILYPLKPTLDIPSLVAGLGTVRWLHAVPALMREVVAAVARDRVPTPALAGLFVGGDAVPADLLVAMRTTFPGTQIRVLYGPTESTILASCHLLPQAPAAALPFLGQPLPGVELVVMDRDGQPAPLGVAGELWIGGRGVTRGYWRRPRLTAEKFVVGDSDCGATAALPPGVRRYQSGDLVRWHAEGQLEFLGRRDQQVKVRGFRIELGEIESVLSQHPAVAQAVVIARPAVAVDRGREQQLVAGVVLRAAASLTELRHHLRAQLPDYMVPAVFLILDALPLTPHGKVDRAALARSRPAPGQLAPGSAAGRVQVLPRTALEGELAAIWRDLLADGSGGGIDVSANFFELGGHSLLATRLLARITRTFAVELPLAALFTAPTLAEQAELIRQARTRESALPPLPALVPLPRPQHGTTYSLPLSFAQERMWVMEQLNPNRAVYNVGQALRLRGPLAPARLAQSFLLQVARHEILRTNLAVPHRTAVASDEPRQVVTRQADLDWSEIDLSTLVEDQREERWRALAAAAARTPFDLATDRLLRLRLFTFAPDDHGLVVILHHAICDDWSMGILVREVAGTYRQLSAGQIPAHPPLAIQYADVAAWQREFLAGEVLAQKLAYWQKHLHGELPVLTLPTDFPRPPVQTFHGRLEPLTLSPELTTALRAVGQTVGSTLFMTLLTAFAGLLARCSGQDDLIIGCPVASRTHWESENLIGMFVNLLPLRIDLSGEPTWRELLARVRAVALAGYDHQDVPFEKIVEVVEKRRDLSRAAVRQVGLAMETHALGMRELAPGVVAEPLRLEPGTSRLDLTLFLWEQDGTLTGHCEYNTDLFTQATIAGFLQSWVRVLEHLVSELDQPILRLPPLVKTPAEPAAPRDAVVAPAPADEPSARARLTQVAARSNLTASQLLFWFAHELNPEVLLYFDLAITTFKVAGVIDPERFAQAFQRLVDLADALRTTIAVEHGIPQRVIHPHLAAALEVVDLRAESDPEAAFARWLAARSSRRLDLGMKLFDTALVQFPDDTTVFYLNVHHIIADAGSLAKIATTLSRYYQLIGTAGSAALDHLLPLGSYERFVAWEQANRQTPRYLEARQYWSWKLATALSPTRFYPRAGSSPAQTLATRISVELGNTESATVLQLTQTLSVFSPAVIFATVLFAWLNRLGGERRLRVGTPFANRQEEFADTIGLMMNACPLQVEVRPQETFRSLAHQVQRDTVLSARFQFYPVPNPATHPAYDVYFNYQNVAFTELCGLPASFTLIHSGHTQDACDLQVRDFSASGRFTLDFDFNCSAWSAEESQRSVGVFLQLLGAACADPEGLVGCAPLLSAAETQHLLHTLNATSRQDLLGDQPGKRLEQLIRAQLLHTPDAVLVSDRHGALTAQGLGDHARQLAHYLRQQGVGPESFVGVALERSLGLVVSLLAVLEAGAAYLPLDPEYPEARLAFMLQDAKIAVLLTQERFCRAPWAQAPSPPTQAPLVVLERDWQQITAQPRGPLSFPAHDLHPAYLIYTSGSTGQPKGVIIPHCGIVNRLRWMQDAYQLGADDRVLQKTPMSFDVSVWEFFWPLLTGAGLVLIAPGEHRDPAEVLRTIAATRITTLHFVPSLLQAFLHQPELQPERNPAFLLPSLRRVITSGEALSDVLQQRFFAAFSSARSPRPELHNLYGPTEASVDVTAWACSAQDQRGCVPIGRPIANTQIYLWDRRAQLVPLGIAGELLIGGISLARGYWQRPATTAAKFVPHPYAVGERLYRSGDLARYLPQGEIEFLGRLDHQIKLRGFRIELGEIEAVVLQHQDVAAAALTLTPDPAGNPRLVAFVVPRAPGLDLAALRAHLAHHLPEYMVPAVWVQLPELPLTPSGKVDRKALKAPEPDPQTALPSELDTPQTPLEAFLVGVFAEVLGVATVSTRASFFDLGGNSLMATQVVSLVREVLPLEIALRDVFQAPTVAAIAVQIEQGRARLSAEENQFMDDVLAEFLRMSADGELAAVP